MTDTENRPPQHLECDCWAKRDDTLPHLESCSSLIGRKPSNWWLLLARVTMELLRRPSTQLTVQRGRFGRRSMWETQPEDNKLLTLRMLVEPDAEDRIWPAPYPGDALEVAEALGIAMAEAAEAVMKGQQEEVVARLPPTQQKIEDALELAYWRFDALAKSKSLSERDAFKNTVRDLVSAVQTRDLEKWSTEGSPIAEALREQAEQLIEFAREVVSYPAAQIDARVAVTLASIVLRDRGVKVEQSGEVVVQSPAPEDETTS